MYIFFIHAFCLFFLLFTSASEGAHRFNNVKANLVRIAVKKSPNIEMILMERTRIIDIESRRTFITRNIMKLNVRVSNPGITINNTEFGNRVKIPPQEDSLIRVDKNLYRGGVEIVKDKGSLLVINELNVEEYLKGVLNEEISAKWHPESLKAQAVVARTYALYQKGMRKNNLYHMKDTTADQVYGGVRNENEMTNKAIEDTKGIVLTYRGKFAKAFYHSISGGITEDVTDVWGGEGEGYLKGIKCEFDKDAPNYHWETEIDNVDLEIALLKNGIKVDGLFSIEPTSFTSSKRVSELQIRHRNGVEKISGVNFRKIIGYDEIKSTLFRIKKNEGSFVFYGRGSGHGVGLCQWGAKGMAERGYSFIDILKYYYPGIEIKKIKN
jgi:stage II sporulation protein D